MSRYNLLLSFPADSTRLDSATELEFASVTGLERD